MEIHDEIRLYHKYGVFALQVYVKELSFWENDNRW